MCEPFEITDYDNIPPDVCYKLVIWSLQQKYSNLTYSYLQNIQFGNFCNGEFERVKMFKRALMVLNRYDIRDIVSNTTEYNLITYTEIKKIINILKNNY